MVRIVGEVGSLEEKKESNHLRSIDLRACSHVMNTSKLLHGMDYVLKTMLLFLGLNSLQKLRRGGALDDHLVSMGTFILFNEEVFSCDVHKF